jgi:hypothetical protein
MDSTSGTTDVRLVLRDNGVERLPVEHGDHFKVVGHLHGRGTGVGINGNDMLAQTLEGDDDLFSELARAEEHDFFLHDGKLARHPCRSDAFAGSGFVDAPSNRVWMLCSSSCSVGFKALFTKLVNADKVQRFARRNIFNSFLYRKSKATIETE